MRINDYEIRLMH